MLRAGATYSSGQRRDRASRIGRGPPSQLEVPVDEVVLLQPAQPLADLVRPGGAGAVHGLEIAVAGADDRVERAEIPYDVADYALRDARQLLQHAVAARGDRDVQGVGVPGVAEQPDQLVDGQEPLVRKLCQPLEHRG